MSMAACPMKNWFPENAASWRVSFNRQGPAAKPDFAKLFIRGILTHHRVMNPIEIQTVSLRQHVKLVGNREIEVTPAIGEQLGKFCLDRRQFNHRIGNKKEQIASPLECFGFKSSDDLWQRYQFF